MRRESQEGGSPDNSNQSNQPANPSQVLNKLLVLAVMKEILRVAMLSIEPNKANWSADTQAFFATEGFDDATADLRIVTSLHLQSLFTAANHINITDVRPYGEDDKAEKKDGSSIFPALD